MIFVSTTYFKKERSNLIQPLSQLKDLAIDGIEIGSTHIYDNKKNYKKIIEKIKGKKFFLHNFFPPIKNKNFVINISSKNKIIRNKSIDIIINNIDFSNDVGAELYTFHPGFLSLPSPKIDIKNSNYDFKFSDNKSKYTDAFEHMIKSLKKITSYAKTKKTRIAIETEGSVKKKDFLLMQKPSEFKKLFKMIPNNLHINLNIAHTLLASKVYGFSFLKLLKIIKKKVVAVELSCNDGLNDQHLPITSKSNNLKYVKYFKNTPIILEFRNTSLETVKNSISVLKKFLKKYD